MTDIDLVKTTVFAERCVKEMRPNAKLLFSTDRRGIVTHVGVYDLPLLLNDRHSFDPIRQYPPQLIGTRFPFQESYQERSKLRLFFDAWTAAYVQLVALNGIK